MAAKTKTMELRFPARGVARRDTLRSAPDYRGPFPTPWAVNVRLEDAIDGRLRGGSWVGTASTAIPADQNQTLVDENGDTITDGTDPLVVSPQESIASSGGSLWVSPGPDTPTQTDADVIYRGRLLRTSDNAILASRQGDYEDFDYGKSVGDAGRAFVIQLSEAGEVGGDVVAMIPHKDRHLLGFTSGSVWALQGDPTAGGMLRNVSREVGIVTARSWCKDHLDRVFFLSSHGFYTIGADGSGLEAISEEVIPQELTGVVDPDTVLFYDHDKGGVYIEIPTAAVSWFFDTERKIFWPYDTGTTQSHVGIGPLKLGDATSFGRVLRLHGMTASGSADVTWRLLVGNSADEVADNLKTAITLAIAGSSYSQYVHSSGVWTAGINHRSYPRARAPWAVLWLSASGSWAYEGASMVTVLSGAWR